MQGIYSIKQISEILFPVFESHGVKRAILFGSYGKGTATEKSDIDLLVDSGLRGLRFFGLLSAVQSALSKDIDLLDVSCIEKDSLIDQEIRNTGVIVYEK